MSDPEFKGVKESARMVLINQVADYDYELALTLTLKYINKPRLVTKSVSKVLINLSKEDKFPDKYFYQVGPDIKGTLKFFKITYTIRQLVYKINIKEIQSELISNSSSWYMANKTAYIIQVLENMVKDNDRNKI